MARIYWQESVKIFILRSDLKDIKKYGFKEFINRRKKHKIEHENRKERFEQYRIKKEKEVNLKVLPTKKYELDLHVEACLFAGIMANIHEWRFFIKNKNPFVMPTYFSFFGLFNIQKRGEEINFGELNDTWNYVCENSQNENQPFCDNHTLRESKNFCIDNGKLKLVDYGNRQIAEFLKINGENLYNNFRYPD